MWQPKQPASEVVASLTFTGVLDGPFPYISALRDLRQLVSALIGSRSYLRSPIGSANPTCLIRIAPTGQTCAALSVIANVLSTSLPLGELMISLDSNPRPASPNTSLLIDVAARSHAQFALNAAAAVDDRVGMRRVHVQRSG